MPAARLFLLLSGLTVLLIGSVAVPWLAIAVLALDAGLLLLFWIDLRRARRRPLEARRTWPQMLVQGSESTLEIDLENPSSRPLTVRLREGLHPFLAAAARRRQFEIPPHSRAHWQLDLLPRNRGDATSAPLTARILGPWKLAWSQRDLLAGDPCRIFPQVRWQGRVGELLARAQRNQLGATPLRWQGSGSEPYAVRDYLPGDPPNRIHWKATARHGRLVSREHTWERGARLVILLDCGRAMTAQGMSETGSKEAHRSKLDYAVAAALALTRVAAARGDRVTLLAFSDRVHRVVRVSGGSRGIAQAYASLFDLRARLREPAFDTTAEKVFELEKRSATVVLFTSVIDLGAAELLREALLRLERRHRPLLVNLTDPELANLADQAPKTAAEAFAQIGALEIRLANGRLAKQLRRGGVRVVNTPADRLALESLEAYLSLFRGRGQRSPARSPAAGGARAAG